MQKRGKVRELIPVVLQSHTAWLKTSPHQSLHTVIFLLGRLQSNLELYQKHQIVILDVALESRDRLYQMQLINLVQLRQLISCDQRSCTSHP